MKHFEQNIDELSRIITNSFSEDENYQAPVYFVRTGNNYYYKCNTRYYDTITFNEVVVSVTDPVSVLFQFEDFVVYNSQPIFVIVSDGWLLLTQRRDDSIYINNSSRPNQLA
jgi:hypothetical protein